MGILGAVACDTTTTKNASTSTQIKENTTSSTPKIEELPPQELAPTKGYLKKNQSPNSPNTPAVKPVKTVGTGR